MAPSGQRATSKDEGNCKGVGSSGFVGHGEKGVIGSWEAYLVGVVGGSMHPSESHRQCELASNSRPIVAGGENRNARKISICEHDWRWL